jgi:phosphatidylglycerophosphate synthase
MKHPDIFVSKVLLLAAVCLAIIYLFRIRIKGRVFYDRVEKQGGSPLLSKSVMEMGYWALQPFSRFLVRHGISANAISYSALFFGALSGISLALGHFGIAAAIGIAGGALDALDGLVARATGTMNTAGKVLDSALDRYVEFFLFVGLIIFYHPYVWIQALVCAALLGAYMVSYTTALSEISDVRLPRGSMQRSERLVYLFLGFTLTPLTASQSPLPLPMLFSLALIACIANVSAVLRLRYIRRSIEAREQRLISLTLAQVRSVRPSPRTPPRFGT